MHNSRDTSSSDPRNIENEENTDSLDQLDQFITKRNLQFLIINCCLGSFLIGYAMTLTNVTFQVVQENNKDISISDEAMVPCGAAIGSLVIVSKVFKIGRKVVLITADLIAIVGSIICISKQDWYSIVGMFIIGIAVGINSIFIPIYLMEYAPCYSGKGRVIITHHFFVIFGISTSFLWGLLINKENNEETVNIKDSVLFQRLIFIIPLSLSAIRLGLLTLIYKSDTPFFYLLKNQKNKARQIIYSYYQENQADKLLELFEIKQARQMEGSTRLKDMLQLRYRRRVGISCLMNFFCYFSGVFFILMYSKESLDQIQQYSYHNQIRTLIIGVILLTTQFFQIFFARILGRKTILLIGQTLYVIGFIGLSAVYNYDFDSFLNVVTTFQGIIGIGFCFQSSVIPIIINEILPERGVAAAHIISLFSICVGAFIYPFLFNYQFIFYLISTCFCVLGFVLLYHFVQETRGLTSFQIEKIYTQNFHGQIKDADDSDLDITRNIIPLEAS